MVEIRARYWLVLETTTGNMPMCKKRGPRMIPPAMPTMPPRVPAKKQKATTLAIAALSSN